MLRDSVATESINGFASEQADVQPSEPIFVLTGSQLQQIIKEATQGLQDRVEALEDIVANLESKVSDLEATQDTQGENELNMLRLINDLSHKEPRKMEISRVEKIEKYLQARPDHKATYETLKGYLGVKNDLLNDAINALVTKNPGKYGITKDPGDKRKRSLVMLARY